MQATSKLGKRGEDEACELLIKKGHAILERNYRCGHLEIDIISIDSDGLHFVEVKTRMAPVCAEPEEKCNPFETKKNSESSSGLLEWHEKCEITRRFRSKFRRGGCHF